MNAVNDHRTGASDELSLADVVAFFRRHWKLVFGTACGFGAATLLVLVLFVPRSWEASATLVIVPPKFTSELTPGTLTVQGYQQLLQSDAVLAETKRRLVQQGSVATDTVLRIGKNVETRIFVARRAEELELAPMVEAIARGRTPEQAAAIANTWAEVFLGRTNELMAGTTSSTVESIEGQYPAARDALAALEENRASEAHRFQASLDEATNKWSRQITEYGNETTRLLAERQAETRALLESYKGEHALNVRQAQFDSLRSSFGDLQKDKASVKARLQQRQLELAAARSQLAATAPTITLHKAITDEALWQKAAPDKKPPDWKALRDRSLVSEEVNPVYTSLASQVSQLEVEVAALEPRAEELSKGLEEIATELKGMDQGLRTDQAGLEGLERERAAGQDALAATREGERARLERLQNQERLAIEGVRAANLNRLDREINQQRQLFEDLAKSYNQAQLAKAQQDIEDVRLAAEAVPPARPVSRGALKLASAAWVLGMLLAFMLAALRDASRPTTSGS